MRQSDAICGAIGFALVLTIIGGCMMAWAMSVKLTADIWSAIAAMLLVVVTIFLVVMAEIQRRSAESVADKQIEAAAKLERTQTGSIKWMEQQKTRPYCNFIIVANTSTNKPLGVYLKNFGHGPALKMKWKFTHNKQAIQETGRKGVFKIATNYGINTVLEVYCPEFLGASSEEAIFRMPDIVPHADPHAKATADYLRMRHVEKLKAMIKAMDIELGFVSIMGQSETIKLHNPDDVLDI